MAQYRSIRGARSRVVALSTTIALLFGLGFAAVGSASATEAPADMISTVEPTATPTVTADAPAPTPTDGAEPSTDPSAEPSIDPSAEPTAEPSAEPSAEPTAEPISSPEPETTEAPSPAARTMETLAAPAEGTATISGRLIDSVTKLPLAGLSVELKNQRDDYAGYKGPTATSNADGAFTFSVSESTWYYAEVTNDVLGYVRTHSNDVNVALGQNYALDDVEVVRGGTISGALAAPAELLGVLRTYVMASPISGSSYGSGSSSVSVELSPGKSTHWDLAVAPGTYNVQLSNSYAATQELWWNSTGNVATKSAAEAIVVTVGNTFPEVDGTLSYGEHLIRGTVRDDQGNPLADVSVQARPTSSFGSSSYDTTSANGTYVLGNLGSQNYVVQFSPQQGDGVTEYYQNAATFEQATPLTFTAGDARTYDNIDATIERGYSISGTVKMVSSRDKYVSILAKTVDGTVTKYGSWNSADGSYTIQDLASGKYTVKFSVGSATQYYGGADTVAEATVLTVPDGDITDLVGINASIEVATVSGTVASTPGTYQQVEMVALDGTESIATGYVYNGEYSVDLKPGSYKARILENNGISQYYNGVYTLADAETIVVADGETFTANFGVVGGTISGTVTADASVAGTAATLYRADDTYNSIRTVTLDETGAYSFAGLAPNNYVIKIATNDTLFAERWFGPSGKKTDATAIDLKANAVYNTADVVLTGGGGIRGTITLPANSNNVYLHVYSAENNSLPTIYPSSIDGSNKRTWSVAGLPAGDYRVQLSSSGSSFWWQDGTSFETATPITVTAGSWSEDIDFAPGVSISGTMTSALKGSTVSQGHVYAYPVGENYPSYYAYASFDGSYVFTDLPAGEYNLKFDGYSYDSNYRQTAFHTQWYLGAADLASATPVTVIDGVATSDINVIMQPGIAISGTVTDAATGAPIANASISGWPISSATTDANGHYETTINAPGTFELDVSSSAYVRQRASLDVPTEGMTKADVQLVSGTVIWGTVTAANNGVPLSNVTVYISTDNQDWWSYNSAYTDYNGNFTSQPLLPGTYYVRFENSQGQYVTQWFDGAATADRSTAVEVGIEPVTDIDAQLTLGGGIVGTITGSDGKPLVGAKIGLATAPTNVFARFAALLFSAESTTGGELLGIETYTGSDGSYTLPPVEPGRYVLYVYDKDHKTTWYNGKTTRDQADVIVVEAGQTQTVPFVDVQPLATGETALEPQQTLSNAFAVTQQPADQSIESGYSATFSAFASGTPLPSIQWQSDETGDWVNLSGQTSTTLNVTAPAHGDPAVNYRAVFAQNDETLPTNAAALTVLAPITAPDAPALPTIADQNYSGGTVSWTAPASNGAAITGYTIKVYDDATLVRTVPTGAVLTSSIGGLTNGTEYEVTLTANNSEGASAESERATLSTQAFTAPSAPATPTLAAIDSTQVTATWVAPSKTGGTPVTGYTVNLYQGTDLVETTTTDARTRTFTGLTRATAYTVEVVATNSAGSSSASARSAEATTKATVPDAAGAPTLEKASASKITVSWTAPNDGGADLTGYTVRLFNGSELVEAKTSTATTVTFAGLVRGISYTADVAATNSVGAGTASVASAAVTIPVTIPGIPHAPTLTADSATKITAIWAAPADDGGTPVTGYTVNLYQGADLLETATTDALTFTFTGLTRATAYTAEVIAENVIGSGSASDRSAAVSTPTTLAGAPTTLNIGAVSASQIAVTWSAPDDDGGTPITGYTIKLFQGTELVSTDKTGDPAFTFTGLTRATAYTVEIFATNAVGDGPVSERSVEVTTPATVPDAAAAPTLERASVSEITVSWAAPHNGGAAITGYTVRLFNGNKLVEKKTTDLAAVTFAGLVRGIAYTADVSAASTIGSGAVSVKSEALTIALAVPGVPDAPTITASSATEIAVVWTAPVDDGGSSITGYRVNVYQGAELVKTDTTDALTLTFTGLTRATAYTAEVIAVNGIGGDAVSDRSIAVSTPTTIPGIPATLVLTASSASQIAASWAAPVDNGGTAVTNYTVKLFQGSTLVGTQETANLSVTFAGLIRATAYTAEIFAVNAVGAGPISDRSAAATTKATVPDAAAAPTLVVASASGISITWTAPSDGGAAVTGYIVRLFTGDTLLDTKSTAATTLTFAGLARGIAYTADVAAINSTGAGSASTRSAAATIPATTPDAPAAPSVTAVSATGASVTWSTPAINGGSALTGYTISVWAGEKLVSKTTTDAATTTATFAGLAPATDYTVTVQATNAVGSSADSADSVNVRTKPTDPTEEDLTEVIKNEIVPDSVDLIQGESVTISGLKPGERYYAFFLSTPIGTSWQIASSTGTITVQVPTSFTTTAHRIAVSNAAGLIIGWASVTINPAPVGPDSGTTAVPAAVAPAAAKNALAGTGTDPLPFTLLAGVMLALGAAVLTVGRRQGRAGLAR